MRSFPETKDEIIVYDKAEVSVGTGETESYDDAVFPEVIRRREIDLSKSEIQASRPKVILDYGCGGGWLSLKLFRWGFNVVGIDVSLNMVKNAKLVCPEADFIVADAVRLPFRESVFDCVIGISILHHLDDLKQACCDLKRVLLDQSKFVFMETNLLNPLSTFGRKFFPMEAHTKGEKQFTHAYLKTALNLADFNVEKCFALFFLAFPVARFSKIAKVNPPSSLVKKTYFFENVMEKLPMLRHLNSNIIAIGRVCQKNRLI